MAAGEPAQPSSPRRINRRQVVGGALAAGSVAVAYAALGDKLNLFSSDAVVDPAFDAAALKQEPVRINHLLRRAGFGASSSEHEHYQALGLEGTLQELLDWNAVDDSTAVGLADAALAASERPSPALWWLVRMANTRRPLQEKMTLFWHGLLTSQLSVVRSTSAMLAQNEFFRASAFDAFPAILRGISMDPAMMIYLDMSGSLRRAPNENYARELMELFALGEGNYSEDDVREAARAFTGWNVPRTRLEQNNFQLETPVFRPQQFDDGVKTFLGHSGNFMPDDIVQIVSEQPAAAIYITRRLYAFFIHPNPSETDIAPFVRAYNENGQRIGAVVEAMLRSDVFYSPRAYRSLVKSPIEYAVGAVKAIGAQELIGRYSAAERGGGGVLGAMGQVPFEPPNVAGWPGGASWLNSATLFARLNFINSLTGGATPGQQPRERQAAPALPPLAGDLGTTAQALAHYLPLVLDDNIPPDARRVLIDYAGGEDVSLGEQKLRGLVYLMLASPQFHLS